MDLNEQINQLEADLQEITGFLEKAEQKSRPGYAEGGSRKRLRGRSQGRKNTRSSKQERRRSNDHPQRIHSQNNNYGWDQSEKFVKIYVTLKGVHQIAPENVEVSFKDRSFVLLVKDLDGKNHQMTMNNLLCAIDTQESSKKIKTDMILVMCKKTSTKKWDCLTQVEKQAKEKDKPSVDTDTDPSDGLMTMLKKIYSDGDDEMKRTINKAWSESQEKKAKGEDGMGMMDF